MKKIICRITKKHIWKEENEVFVVNRGLTGRLVTSKCERCGEDKKEFYGTFAATFDELLTMGMSFTKDTELTITHFDGIRVD